MKKILIMLTSLLSTFFSTRAQQFNNGNFSSYPNVFSLCNPGAGSWEFGGTNTGNPQITNYNNGNNVYIDITPCGGVGNGSWIQQKIEVGKKCIYQIKLDLRPMNGNGDAGVIVTMDGIQIGNRLFATNTSAWTQITSSPFWITPGVHTFRFTGQSNGKSTPNVMGLDNIILEKICSCTATNDVKNDGLNGIWEEKEVIDALDLLKEQNETIDKESMTINHIAEDTVYEISFDIKSNDTKYSPSYAKIIVRRCCGLPPTSGSTQSGMKTQVYFEQKNTENVNPNSGNQKLGLLCKWSDWTADISFCGYRFLCRKKQGTFHYESRRQTCNGKVVKMVTRLCFDRCGC